MTLAPSFTCTHRSIKQRALEPTVVFSSEHFSKSFLVVYFCVAFFNQFHKCLHDFQVDSRLCAKAIVPKRVSTFHALLWCFRPFLKKISNWRINHCFSSILGGIILDIHTIRHLPWITHKCMNEWMVSRILPHLRLKN